MGRAVFGISNVQSSGPNYVVIRSYVIQQKERAWDRLSGRSSKGITSMKERVSEITNLINRNLYIKTELVIS